MAVNNATILAKTWLNGTNDFQQRIPDPTQAGIKATTSALFDPMNRQYLNWFIDTLINRIGYTIVRSKRWENPLGFLKGAKVEYGMTIQDIAVKWLRAHTYADDAEDLLKVERPEVAQVFYSVNRRDKYKITWNESELSAAFAAEYGLNTFLNGIMDAPYNSDAYDEYRLMLNILAEYSANNDVFNVHVDEPTDETTARALLKQIRAYSGLLKFPSTMYNGVDVPVFVQPDELILITTPVVKASLDVDALAAAFNVDRMEAQARIVEVDSLPEAGDYAYLTTEDFFVVHDKIYTTTNFYDPNTLNNHWWLHHWEFLYGSPMMPLIRFSADAATETKPITQTATGFELAASADTVKPGGTIQLTPKLNGTIAPETEGVTVSPATAAVYALSAETPAKTDPATAAVPKQLNAATRVDENNVLHVQKTGLAAGDVIHITATSTYRNPSGETPQAILTPATKTITIA